MLSETTQKRIREAVGALHKKEVYPSVEKVALELGRFHTSMSKDERQFRIDVLSELGIKNKLMRKQ